MSSELFAAVEKCNLKGIQVAIGKGASIEEREPVDGYTALHVLCKSKSGVMGKSEIAAAMWLIEQGADVSAESKNRETPLHLAVSSGSHDVIEGLLACGSKATRDKWGNTPLHRCLETNEKDTWIWDKMLLLGCKLDDKNEAGDTPLHEAQVNWNVNAVKYLLSKGADREVKDAKGKTVRQRAEELKQDKILKLLK